MTVQALVVDDDLRRASRIREIVHGAGGAISSVHTCGSITAAIKILLEHRIDLLISDIAIPEMDGESPRADGGQLLVKQIEDLSPQIVSPRWTIAITAYEESKRLTDLAFSSRLVSVLNAQPGNNEWESQLANFCRRAIDSGKRDTSSLADVCILTALRSPELDAITDLPISWGLRTVSPFLANQQSGEMNLDGKKLSVEVFTYDKMGLVPMAYLTSAVVANFRPKILILTGICGGVADGAALGDVVVAESSWNWQAGKLKGDDPLRFDSEYVQGSASLVALARHASASESERMALLALGRHLLSQKDRIPSIHVGPMASGSVVVASTAIKDEIVAQNRKVVALDMEAHAFYAASRFSALGDTQMLCIKSVCDRADVAKADELQILCARRSAYVATAIIKEFFTEKKG